MIKENSKECVEQSRIESVMAVKVTGIIVAGIVGVTALIGVFFGREGFVRIGIIMGMAVLVTIIAAILMGSNSNGGG